MNKESGREDILYQPVRLAKIYARPLQNNKTAVKKECNHSQTLKNSYKSRRLKYEKYNFFQQCVQQFKSIKLLSSCILSYQQGISYTIQRLTIHTALYNDLCIYIFFSKSLYNKHCAIIKNKL